MFSLFPYFGCLDWNGAVKLQSEKKGKGKANAESRLSRRRLHVAREGAPEVNSELIDTLVTANQSLETIATAQEVPVA